MKFAIIAAFLLSIPGIGFASIIIVPDDQLTIQGAIDAASNGDTIIVRPGTYIENIDFIGKSITLQSEQGAAVTAIDGNQAGSVVTFQSGEGYRSVLDGFTLTNGIGTTIEYYPGYTQPCGGGILLCNSSPTIMNSTISGNEAYLGGGIYCNYSSPFITNDSISVNTASSSGGGITCDLYSAPTIINNIIAGNSLAYDGGGIACRFYSAPIISNNIISGNSVDNRGGGISCGKYCSPAITNNAITGNVAGDDGGGINCYFSSQNIINNTISGNSATRWGGGIYSSSSSSTIASNIISGNTADQGGGIICRGSWPTIKNNTITENTANEGGGIYFHHDSLVTVTNTIFWDNSAPTGAEIWVGGLNRFPEVTISYSDVEGGQASIYVDPNSTLNWGAGMIDADPLFVDPTSDDFHLTWQSPCRNTGDDSVVTEPDDFEGDPRTCGSCVDMGADEYWYHLYLTGDPVPGGSVTLKVVGIPGNDPVRIYRGSLRSTPQSTQYGMLCIKKPFPHIWDVGPVPADGIATTTKTIPSGVSPGAEFYFQALHGPVGDPNTKLTNLLTVTVE